MGICATNFHFYQYTDQGRTQERMWGSDDPMVFFLVKAFPISDYNYILHSFKTILFCVTDPHPHFEK